jgi:DNA-binding NarL/FixJ family response regulator
VIRVLVVDDEPDMRVLIRHVLAATPGVEVVAEADGAEAAIEAWRAMRPDLVVLDHRMPRRSGLDVAAEILAEAPGQPIILFSAFLDSDLRARAATLGVRRCLSKDDVFSLPDVVRDAAA